MKQSFREAFCAAASQRGFGLAEPKRDERRPSPSTATARTIGHGAVVIAAITSCTNTSNPA